jgi:transcription elongation factor Elf1
MYGKRRSIRELSEQERQHYYRWWKKYVTLKRVAQIGLSVCVFCGVVSFTRHELSHLVSFIFYPAFCVTVISGVWWTFLECPRCGTKFSGWWGSEYDEWNTTECQECGLSFHDLSALSRR